MRQILMDSHKAFIARMPCPSLVKGTVLVKVRYSMVSIGTETAALRQRYVQNKTELSQLAHLKSTFSEAIQLSKTAARYLMKAIQYPELAKQRLKTLAKQKFNVLQQKVGNVATLHDDTLDIGWNVGYSAIGDVLAVGPNVSDLAVGDVVVCAGAGYANHADVINVPRHLVCRVPANCDPVAASSTTIGSIALQGVRRAAPQLGEQVAVIGLGLLGQITAQLLKCNGCKIIGLDLHARRVEQACELGMQHGSTSMDDFKQQIDRLTATHGTDITIITAATKSDAVINLAMEITRRKGKVVIVGDVGLHVERSQFYKKEIDLLMSTSYGPGRYDEQYEEQGHDYPFSYVRWTLNRNMQAYLDLIASEQIKILPLIDKVAEIEQATQIYDDIANQPVPPLAVVFAYGETTLDPEPVITLRGHREPSKAPVNYVLVGAGAFGISMLVPAFNRHKDIFFQKGVVSRDPVRGGNYARQHELEIFASDIEGVITNPAVHMLVIATRHHEHAAQVISALQAGKHVFVEKPLATTWEQLDAIQACIDDLPQIPMVMVGFNRRFSPAMQCLKSELATRKTPLIIQYRMNGGFIPQAHWIQTRAGAGRNIGEACHIYDCFQYLIASPIVDISATAIGMGEHEYLRNDNFVATIRYEDGSIATLTYTAAGPKQGMGKERMEVFNEGEAYVLEDYQSLLRKSDNHMLWSGNVDKGHANEISAVAASFRTGNSAPIELSDIMETTALALRIEDLLHDRA